MSIPFIFQNFLKLILIFLISHYCGNKIINTNNITNEKEDKKKLILFLQVDHEKCNLNKGKKIPKQTLYTFVKHHTCTNC